MTEVPDLAPLSEAEREELRRLRLVFAGCGCDGTNITNRIADLSSREDIVDPTTEAERLTNLSNPESSSRKDSTNA